MAFLQRHSPMELLHAFFMGNEDEARHLAEVSLVNGSAAKHAELSMALLAAQRAGVTTSQYLRARALLRAGILTEWRDDRGSDD